MNHPRFFVSATTTILLAGCHADITYRFDLRGDGTALVTTREVIDGQLYDLALSQNTNGDPFGADKMQQEGWTVTRVEDESGNHVITISKQLDRDELKDAGSITPALRGTSLPFSPSEVSSSVGLFVERDSLSLTIPALLPLAMQNGGSSYAGGPFAGAASAMLASMVSLHLDLRTPGKVLSTNGETMPDGFVRWDLNLQAPTTIEYSVQRIYSGRVTAAVIIALLILGSILVVARNKLKTSATLTPPA
jgi:hypothetical protein